MNKAQAKLIYQMQQNNAKLKADRDVLLKALKDLVEAIGPAHIELSSVKAVRLMGKLLDAQKEAATAIKQAESK